MGGVTTPVSTGYPQIPLVGSCLVWPGTSYKMCVGWVWCHVPLIPEPSQPRQVDLRNVEANLVYIGSTTQPRPCLEKTNRVSIWKTSRSVSHKIRISVFPPLFLFWFICGTVDSIQGHLSAKPDQDCCTAEPHPSPLRGFFTHFCHCPAVEASGCGSPRQSQHQAPSREQPSTGQSSWWQGLASNPHQAMLE